MLPLRDFPGNLKRNEIRWVTPHLLSISLICFNRIQFYSLPEGDDRWIYYEYT